MRGKGISRGCTKAEQDLRTVFDDVSNLRILHNHHPRFLASVSQMFRVHLVHRHFCHIAKKKMEDLAPSNANQRTRRLRYYLCESFRHIGYKGA
jgi:hypothetical protein